VNEADNNEIIFLSTGKPVIKTDAPEWLACSDPHATTSVTIYIIRNE